jgi:D-glycero-alpha-D-manno-heptose-7-phosphate kinase
MISIAKTPVRISFFGGGTDYPGYFENSPGAVLGTTINKYVYTLVLPMSGIAEHKYRITYRQVDGVDTIDEIKHPVVRAALRELDYHAPLNIAIISDMPGGTGLGSSSAFTVGFVNLIQNLKGQPLSRYDLAQKAIFIERDVLKENVGVQDQVHAAFGGLAHYSFHGREFMIRPVNIHTECRKHLNDCLLLVYTGGVRHASASLSEQVENTRAKKIDKELSHLFKMTHDGIRVLEQTSPDSMLEDLGRMLNESWLTKRSLSSSVTNDVIDDIYKRGLNAGALGGKLCGAGKGGFFLFLAPPHRHQAFFDLFGADRVIKVEIEDHGSRVSRGWQSP